MSNSIYKFDEDTVNELSTIEVAYEILKQSKKPFLFKELSEKIGEVKDLSSERMLDFLPQLYTELNIDGRFIHVGKNEWGLKSWYSLEKAEELQLLKDTDDEEEDEDIIYLNDDDNDEVVDDIDLYKVDKDLDEDTDDDLDDNEEEVDKDLDDELIFEDEDEDEDEEEIEETEDEGFYYIDEELEGDSSDENEQEDNR